MAGLKSAARAVGFLLMFSLSSFSCVFVMNVCVCVRKKILSRTFADNFMDYLIRNQNCHWYSFVRYKKGYKKWLTRIAIAPQRIQLSI